MPKVSDEYVEERREQILNAALRCFSRQGLHRTTLDEICSEAELSKGAVYNYFKSKQEIIQAVRDRSADEEEVQASPLIEPGGLEGIRTVARELFGRIDNSMLRDERRVAAMLWSEALLDADTLRAQVASLAPFRPELANAVREAQAKGALPALVDPEALAVLVLGAMLGTQLQHEWEPGTDVHAVADAFDALLMSSSD